MSRRVEMYYALAKPRDVTPAGHLEHGPRGVDGSERPKLTCPRCGGEKPARYDIECAACVAREDA